jgi:hypothetical protein
MGLIIGQDSGGGFKTEPIPADLYPAVFCGVVDIGTQETANGEKRQVRIVWEIPELRQTGEIDGQPYDRPRNIAKKYTLSFHEKASLFKHLCSARGKQFTPDELKAFDLFSIIGKPCQLQVAQFTTDDGKTIAYVENVVKFKGNDAPQMETETPLQFAMSDWDGKAKPESLPDWLWETIRKSPEYAAQASTANDVAAVAAAFGGDVVDDDCPF